LNEGNERQRLELDKWMIVVVMIDTWLQAAIMRGGGDE